MQFSVCYSEAKANNNNDVWLNYYEEICLNAYGNEEKSQAHMHINAHVRDRTRPRRKMYVMYISIRTKCGGTLKINIARILSLLNLILSLDVCSFVLYYFSVGGPQCARCMHFIIRSFSFLFQRLKRNVVQCSFSTRNTHLQSAMYMRVNVGMYVYVCMCVNLWCTTWCK